LRSQRYLNAAPQVQVPRFTVRTFPALTVPVIVGVAEIRGRTATLADAFV
jgi:hypothetical protein